VLLMLSSLQRSAVVVLGNVKLYVNILQLTLKGPSEGSVTARSRRGCRRRGSYHCWQLR